MIRRVRLVVQVAMVGLFLLPLAGVPFVAGTLAASRLFGLALADPLAALESGLAAGRLVGPLAAAAGLVVLVYLFLGRAFCAWVCPVGLLTDLLGRVVPRRRLLGKMRAEWVLAGVLCASLLLGIPVFQMVSPVNVVLRAALFGGGLEVLLLVAVLIVDLAFGRKAWCVHLCPLGAFYGLLGRVGFLRVRLRRDACNRCGECVKRCPMGTGVLADAVAGRGPAEARGDLCTRCGDCLAACPHSALAFSVSVGAPSAGVAVDGAARRSALAYLGAGALALGGRMVTAGPVARLTERTRLRPPGAVPEPAFLAQCLRCGQCEQVCPLEAIKLGHASEGLSVGTPYIVARDQACNLCMECVKVCPSGALVPTEAPRMGVAEIDRERCLSWQGTICRACFNNCPRLGQALTLEAMQRVLVNPDQCTGCGMCEEVCVLEEAAIVVRPLG